MSRQIKVFPISAEGAKEASEFVDKHVDGNPTIGNNETSIIVIYENEGDFKKMRVQSLKAELKRHLNLALTSEMSMRQAIYFRNEFKKDSPDWKEKNEFAYQQRLGLKHEMRYVNAINELIEKDSGAKVDIASIDLMENEIEEPKPIISPLSPEKKKPGK